jgi:phage shock protein PspC (stress-responsive transcriptional regulator)|tara:strand:+ start:2528 stop:2710 length:183 start_codon:yes stop_codon:yes gene_type:complete
MKRKEMKNKLYRTNGYLGGVCQGIADYTDTSAIAWRLIFLFVPCGFWAYLALWILLKEHN